MPRYNVVVAFNLWFDAADENEADERIDAAIDAMKQVPGVNVVSDTIDVDLTEEPRPTKAELMCDV